MSYEPDEEQTTESGEKKKRLRSAASSSLPLVSVLADRTMLKSAKDLMKEGLELSKIQATADVRLKEIKEELSILAAAHDLRGFRWGLSGFEYRGYATRKTLSKKRLVEHGVDPEIIKNSYEESKEYVDCRLVSFDME